MKLLTLETPGIGHYAYYLEDGGEAAIVDPRRDVEEYLQVARAHGARIRYVIETHRQEDFVMGSAHLARRTGAQVVNGEHEIFAHGDIKLADGDTLELGSLTLRALHTPGHTPESMSYAIYTDTGASDRPWGLLTGDALFFGTTGRTDLIDGVSSEDAAAMLYDSIHAKLAPLADSTLVLPAHGPGSVCGSGMRELPQSTLGTEKRTNDVFVRSRSEFARVKGGERPPRPPYFRLMERVNRRGGLPPARQPGEVPLWTPAELVERVERQLVIDTREPEGFAGGHLPGAHSVWMGGLTVFGGWIAEHETPLYLVTEGDRDVDDAVAHLGRIGIDNVQGALAGGFGAWRKSGRPIATAGVMTPREAQDEREQVQVLDVREVEEFEQGHIGGARHVYVGHLQEQLPGLELQRDRPVAVTCSVGHRSGLGVSLLLRAGFTDVRNLLGGMTAWRALELPEEK